VGQPCSPIAWLVHLSNRAHPRGVCALLAHETCGRYLRQTEIGKPVIDRAKVAAEARYDARYLLRTSDDTLSAEDAALGYRQLMQIEDAFRTLKSTLDLRPIHHRLEDRIKAHVLRCWLALLLVRVAEHRTGRRWPLLRWEMQRLHLITYGGRRQRTELTTLQQHIPGRPPTPRAADVRVLQGFQATPRVGTTPPDRPRHSPPRHDRI